MNKINLQDKTKALQGRIEMYYFENNNIQLAKTLYHRIYIPLTSFNSGLEYEPQPIKTTIVMDWLSLKLEDPVKLDGISLSSTPDDEIEVSVYVGAAHNPCDINKLTLKEISTNMYQIECSLFIDFEHEAVASNEIFEFSTQLKLNPTIKYE